MATARATGSLARYVAASGAGALGYSSFSDPASAFQPIWAAVREVLKLPATSTAPELAHGVLESQTAALTASIQAMNQLIAAQQRGGSRLASALVWLAAPMAVGCAIHYFGWGRIGWVTGEQLQQGLASVRTAVGTMVDSLGEALHARFVRVDEMLAETAHSVQQVSATAAELKAEVHAVGESLQALERRMAPIETNCATAAQGVEVLCELVKTSGLLANASGDSLRKLDHFTGSSSDESSARATHLLPPPSHPAPTLPSPLERAAPNFVRAMMEPPAMMHS